ncbi:MAG: serine/threonine protein kinase [Salana multivorans]|nr:serine/threonine protein kinase [Salana multivorans]
MTPRAGVVVDRWELTRLIAIGGMGQVWAAQEKPGGREVALKVLRPEFAGERLFLDRIAAEARNSLDLVHPGIARTYAHGEIDGLGYIVMELVPGEPLSTILARERVLSRRLVLDVVAQTADALATAHEAGVVHRDIKPANLILGPGGRVVLTDFGISLAANQAPMTAAGMVMGTAQYLPPEQAMGRPATGAGDVYALGIIAYESLVGKRPFTGQTQVDIAFAHVTEPVPPLPETIDAPVRELVEQMLEKEPARRPSPASEVATRARELGAAIAPDDGWDPVEPRRARRRRGGSHAGESDAPAIITRRPRPPKPRVPRPAQPAVPAAAPPSTPAVGAPARAPETTTVPRVAAAAPAAPAAPPPVIPPAHDPRPSDASVVPTPDWQPVRVRTRGDLPAPSPDARRAQDAAAPEAPPTTSAGTRYDGERAVRVPSPTRVPSAARVPSPTRARPDTKVPSGWIVAALIVLAAAIVTLAILVAGNLGQSAASAGTSGVASTSIGGVQ